MEAGQAGMRCGVGGGTGFEVLGSGDAIDESLQVIIAMHHQVVQIFIIERLPLGIRGLFGGGIGFPVDDVEGTAGFEEEVDAAGEKA